MRGRVLRVSGQNCLVELGGMPVRCKMRGRLKGGRRESNSPVITGDWVDVEQDGPDQYVINGVEDRLSHFTRASSGSRPYEQIIAVNIQQLVIISSARNPSFRAGFIDRAIVSALWGELVPVIVINKIDLGLGKEVSTAMGVYERLGYQVLQTSAANGKGISDLEAVLKGTDSAIMGHSGVGKSTLLNAIDPNLALRTQEIMHQHDRGRHTTTAVQLYPLKGGGYVADTPGIKELHLYGIQRSEVAAYFDDLRPHIDQCRFRDCSHLNEPECRVRTAVDDGQIAQRRYESYARIMESLSV